MFWFFEYNLIAVNKVKIGTIFFENKRNLFHLSLLGVF